MRTLVIIRDCHAKHNLVWRDCTTEDEKWIRKYAQKRGWKVCVRNENRKDIQGSIISNLMELYKIYNLLEKRLFVGAKGVELDSMNLDSKQMKNLLSKLIASNQRMQNSNFILANIIETLINADDSEKTTEYLIGLNKGWQDCAKKVEKWFKETFHDTVTANGFFEQLKQEILTMEGGAL